MQRALDLAAGLDHPFSMAYALHHAGLLDLWRLDLAGVGARADALLAIAEAHDYPTWRALALVWGGMAMVGSGEVDAGLARVEEGFELYKGLSAPPVFWPALLMIRASALGMAGRGEEGLAFIEEAEGRAPGRRPDGARRGHRPRRPPPRPDPAGRCRPPTPSSSGRRSSRASAGPGWRSCKRSPSSPSCGTGPRAKRMPRGVLQELYDGSRKGFDSPHLVAARAALAR